MKTLRILFAFVLVLSILVASAGSTQAQKLAPYSSSINLFNTGAGDAHITITFYDTTGAVSETQSDTLATNTGKDYLPLQASSSSAVVSSDMPVAAVSNLQTSDKTARSSFVGASAGATVVYLPVLMTNNGANRNDTWFSVQNAGSSATSVSITYSDGCTASITSLAPGASSTINNFTETCHATSGAGGTATKIYSGKVSAGQPLVVVVVQEKIMSQNGQNTGVMYAYTGLGDAGSPTLYFPIVTENNSTNRTGIQIQNNSASTATNIVVTYVPDYTDSRNQPSPFTCTESFTGLAAGASVTFGWPSWGVAIPGGYASTSTCTRGQFFLGSAYVSGNTGNVPLQAVVTQSRDNTHRAGAYSGFSDTLATPKVVMPIIMDRRGVASRLGTTFNLFNIGTASVFYKCIIAGVADSGPVTAPPITGTLAAKGVVNIIQKNAIAFNFLGSGYCITTTTLGGSTVDTSGKIVAVVNESTGYSITDNPAAYEWDSLMIYEGVNTQP